MQKDLKEQVKEISEKLQKHDEEERKKAEQKWREAMGRDTAGTTLTEFSLIWAKMADLQNQIDASNPLAPVIRAVGELAMRVANIEKALSAKPGE